MAEIKDWDIDAANNNAPSPDGYPEDMPFEDVNDTGREDQAVVARWYTDALALTTTAGTAPAYTVASPARTITSYSIGDTFTLKFHAANASTTAPTLDVSSVGAQTITAADGGTIPPNYIQADSVHVVVWDGTNWRLASGEKRSYRGQVFNVTNTASGAININNDANNGVIHSTSTSNVTITLDGGTNPPVGTWAVIIRNANSGDASFSAGSGSPTITQVGGSVGPWTGRAAFFVYKVTTGTWIVVRAV